MKKLISGVLMILMSTSCIFFIWDTEPSGKTAYWYIKNSTDIPLSVSWVKDTSEYLSVGDSLCIPKEVGCISRYIHLSLNIP